MSKWSDLFSSRQLLALTTFSDLVKEVKEKIFKDSLKKMRKRIKFIARQLQFI